MKPQHPDSNRKRVFSLNAPIKKKSVDHIAVHAEMGPYSLVENCDWFGPMKPNFFDMPSEKELDDLIRIDCFMDVELRRFIDQENPENSTPAQLKAVIYILNKRLIHASQTLNLIKAAQELEMPRPLESPREKIIRECYEKEHPQATDSWTKKKS